MSSLRSSSRSPTSKGYISPAHRARLAPAGVVGVGASPTPPSSTANSKGAPVNENSNGTISENQFGEVAVGAPEPDIAIGGEKFTRDKIEFLTVLEELNPSTINFAHRHGAQSVLDAVKSYLLIFLAHVIVPEKMYGIGAALRGLSIGMATPVDLAAKIVVALDERRKTDKLAVMIDDITSLYLRVGSPSPSHAAKMKSAGVNLSAKGMSDVLSKFTSGGGTIDFASDRGVIADTPSSSHTDLPTVDCGGTVISSGSWA